MIRRIIQSVLLLALFCGATSQAFACLSMWAANDHACCRVAIKTSAQKMRAAPPLHKEPASSSPCCESNTSNSRPATAQAGESRQEKPRLATADQLLVTSVSKTEPVIEPAFGPPKHSPPRFILT